VAGRLDGRVALVTGAGNGIGRACALAIGAQGARVVVNDLGTDEFARGTSAGPADATVAAIVDAGGTAVANHDSVADPAGCGRAVQQAIDAYGQLDIVVGCAGAIIDGSLSADDAAYGRFLDLFLSQKFWLARAALPAMAERGWGRLVTTTSHGATGLLGQPIFAAAMGGVISLTKALAHEYRPFGVTANCLAPGAATRLHAVSRANFERMRAEGVISDAEWDQYLGTPPPEYVGPIVAWLCSDAADDVTGQVFHSVGTTLGVWSSYTTAREHDGGGHQTRGPWTMEELDAIVPGELLPDGSII
jgi:NAD(P)-dependent dehydrogenase (short-subunit alcohol dehydrogenase family)